ncbi:MAG: rod shape-determining protein MreC [Firmicutes bacterium]|nr:rod shape-determining protein MreC [Bacillota bacterium]
MNQTTRRVLGIIGLIILLLSLIFFTGKFRSHYTFAEDLIMTGLAPVQGFFSQLSMKTATFFQGIVDYERVLQENKELKTRLAAEDNIRHQLLELQKENHRLREMLDFKVRTEYSLLPAEVIARDPSHWFETITINKGYADGVKKDMAVVTAQGLVGNIMFVSKGSSQVLMLTDSRRAVGALVQRSREPGFIGIVEGYTEKTGYLRLTNLPPEANIQPGDTVISSGLGGIFPKGLVIGYVLETGKDQYGLLQQAIVIPATNFDRLEEVFIVLEFPAEKETLEKDYAENHTDGDDDEEEVQEVDPSGE